MTDTPQPPAQHSDPTPEDSDTKKPLRRRITGPHPQSLGRR
ncbi:hypothetical protein [Streptomyces sp. NPDC055140]